MENLTLIKRIEAYLTHDMSKEETLTFESEIANDPGLGKLVDQYRHTFKVLQQEWLSIGIKEASRSFQLLKVIKVATLSLAGVVAVGLLYFHRGDFKNNKISTNKTDSFALAPVTKATISLDSINTVSQVQNPIKNSILPAVENIDEVSSIYDVESPFAQNLRVGKLLSDFRNTLKPDTQYFSITNLKDTILYGSKGTRIDIPAGSLINFRTQKPVSGNIKIELCEFNNFFSMFSNKISTDCNNRLLESGGSCYLSAKENQDSAFIREDMPLKLGFECKKEDTAMTTFYGVKDANGVVHWEALENSPPIETANPNDSFQIPGSLGYKVTYDTLYFKRSFKKVSATTGRDIFIHLYQNDITNGSNSFFSDTKSHKKWGAYVLQAVIRYPYKSKALGKIYNIIYANKFGYINCDHFLKYINVEDVSIISADTIIESYLFFKETRTCMPSYEGWFQNVPRNSEVLILTIFTRANKLYMSFLNTRTSKRIYIVDLIPLDTDKIKAELNKIDK